MKQGHLSSIFQQTKHHSNAQQHMPAVLAKDNEKYDTLQQFKNLPNGAAKNSSGSKLSSVHSKNSLNATPSTQLQNGFSNLKQDQTSEQGQYDPNLNHSSQKLKKSKQTPQKLSSHKSEARDGSMSNLSNNQSTNNGRQGKNRQTLTFDNTKPKSREVTPKQMAEYMQSISELPTSASTLVPSKKRVQAPSSPVSDEYEQIPRVPVHKESKRSQRSKAKQSRSRSQAQEQIQPRKVQDVEMKNVESEVSKKRKIEEISSTIQQQQDQILELQKDSKRKQFNQEDLIKHGIIKPLPESSTTDNAQKLSKQQSSQKPQQNVGPAAKSILSGLSASTQELMKKALMNSKQPQKSTDVSTPQKQRNSAMKTIQDQDLAFEDMKLEDSPPQIKQQLSQQTKAVISHVMNDPSLKMKQTGTNKNYQQMQVDQLSMRLKHGQLLSITRELVLPSHYKLLLDLQGHLDTSLSFIKRRKQLGKFDELKKSIESTLGRKFDISHFKQMLTIAPDFYSYKWEQITHHAQPQLVIDIKQSDICQQSLDERHKIFKQRLYDYCRGHYDQFIQKLKQQQNLSSQEFLDFDPYKEQMWHHSFDPHTVEPIPMTDIAHDMKNYKRSETVLDFLNKSNIQQSLVQQALEKSVIINKQTQSSSQQQPDDKELLQLTALSQKTGLSIETLRLIKAKEGAIKQSQNIMNKSMVLQDSQKKFQTLSKISEQIRLQMNFKNVSALYLNDLVKSLNDNLRGNFQSTSDLCANIEELATLVPEWLTLKDVKGRLVKINKNVPSQRVQALLQERIPKTSNEAITDNTE
eukprot:403337591